VGVIGIIGTGGVIGIVGTGGVIGGSLNWSDSCSHATLTLVLAVNFGLKTVYIAEEFNGISMSPYRNELILKNPGLFCYCDSYGELHATGMIFASQSSDWREENYLLVNDHYSIYFLNSYLQCLTIRSLF
jgi:hypothetical protein